VGIGMLMVKMGFQEIVDESFQSLQAMEAQQKLLYIQIYEQKLQKLEEELNVFIMQATIKQDSTKKG
jgi:hypothetical protein